MTQNNEIYKCAICGNVVEVVHAAGGTLVCCGKPMTLLTENTTDASHEKHVPFLVSTPEGVLVRVGSAEHPMLPEHFIEWIELETEEGTMRHHLQPGDKPEVTFALGGDKPVSVFAYCNLHGLWRTAL